MASQDTSLSLSDIKLWVVCHSVVTKPANHWWVHIDTIGPYIETMDCYGDTLEEAYLNMARALQNELPHMSAQTKKITQFVQTQRI